MGQTPLVSARSDDHLREAPVRRRLIHSGRLLQVYDDTVRMPGGHEAGREVVVHPGAVAVVAIDDADRVVLVRQWRHPIGRALWELPAGTRDKTGEALQATAERELEEEAGFVASRWRPLGQAPLAPGYSTEVMHFFAACELRPGTRDSAPDELLDVGWFTRSAVAALVSAMEVDVKTLAGLALAGWSVLPHA